MEKFSVLMSVYYKEKSEYFDLALESNLIKQTLLPNEFVLVCDGELTPDLEAVIEKYRKLYPNVLKVYRKENGGLGKALNFGLQFCTYDIIARSDSDDICIPTRFEKQIAFMSENNEYSIISSWVNEFISVPGDYDKARVLPENHEKIYKYAKSRCPVNHPSVVFRKNDVLNVGGYQTDLFPEDYFLWIKMLKNGCKFYNMQESLVGFRFSPETYRRRGGIKYAKDEIKIQIKIYKMGFISFPILVMNLITHTTIRILPNWLRCWIYMNILRKRIHKVTPFYRKIIETNRLTTGPKNSSEF